MGKFIIYKSSAGSGKTFTLIRTFLTMSLRSAPESQFKRILALTFSIRAAGEMRDRLLSELHKITSTDASDLQNDEMVKQLLDALTIEIPELKRRCKLMFQAVLQDFGDLSIGTIDQFNHRLIRAFGRELSLGRDWNVDTKDEKYYKEAIARAIDQVGLDPFITEQLLRFVAKGIDDENHITPAMALESYKKLFLNEDAEKPLLFLETLKPEDFTSIEKQLRAEAKNFKTEIQKQGVSMLELLQGIGFGEKEIANGNTGVYGFIVKLAAGIIPESIGKNVEKARNGNFLTAANEKKIGAQFDAIRDELQSQLASTCDYFEKNKIRSSVYSGIASKMPLLAILSRVQANFRAILAENNVQTISQFNKIISEALLSEPAAFIYEKFGNRYDHILIDEFQDTSALQWYNLLPLMEEGIARAKESMVVGDAKQSIYRWRNGRAEQFIALPELYDPPAQLSPDLAATISREHQLESLHQNFRSQANIVKFNNLLFSELASLFKPEDLYAREYHPESVQQQFRADKPGGYIELSIPDPEDKDLGKYHGLISQIEYCKAANYSYSDMAVLARTGAVCGEIAGFLSEHGFPVTSAESFTLESDAGVRFLIQCMRIAQSPVDNVALVGFMRTMTTKLAIPYEPDRYARDKKIDLQYFLKTAALPEWKSVWNRLPAYEFCAQMVQAYWPGMNNAYMDQFCGYVWSQVGSGASIFTFLKHWDDIDPKYPPKMPGSKGGNAIEVLTIHKSKGLEFPIVFLPNFEYAWTVGDVKWTPMNFEKIPGLEYAPFRLTKENQAVFPEYADTEEAINSFDQLNLIYVAFTRAVNGLFIQYAPSDARASGRIHQVLVSNEEKLRSEFSEFELSGSLSKHFNLRLGTLSARKRKMEMAPEISQDGRSPEMKLPFENIRIAPIANRAQILGDRFHELAILVETPDKLSKKLEKWVARNRVSPAEADELRRDIASLQNDPFYAELRAKGTVLPEQDIAWQGKSLRPDLLIKKPEEMIVIDFKTGEKKDQHSEQLARYIAAIEAITSKKTSGYLIYLHPYEVLAIAPKGYIQSALNF